MLKVGLIGYGFRGKDLLLNMLNHQAVQVIAVCDVCLDKAQNAQKVVQEKTNNPNAYMFGSIIDELLCVDKDIFKIISTAGLRRSW